MRLAAAAIAGEPNALAERTSQAEKHGRHSLNVSPKMYDLWLEALIEAVKACDPRFNRAIEHAWRLLMGHVVRHMVRHY